jgi:hypothetical protein
MHFLQSWSSMDLYNSLPGVTLKVGLGSQTGPLRRARFSVLKPHQHFAVTDRRLIREISVKYDIQ